MAEYAANTNDEIRDGDLLGVARQLIERKKTHAELKKLATKLGFSDSQWKDFTQAFREISDEKEKHKQGIFLMLLYWKKRNPTSGEVQELKKALDELGIDTEGYFQITPEETGKEKLPSKCEECQRYFLNDEGLRSHQGKCDQKPVGITTSANTDNTEYTVHTLQARKRYMGKTFPDNLSAIGVGLRLFPKQTLKNKSVSITMPHCANFSDLPTMDTMKLYRFKSETNNWVREQLFRPGAGYPNIKLQQSDLDLNIDQLDEWWILSPIDSNIFKGKRLICTPFVPSELKEDGRDCVDVCLRDDNGFAEARRPGWKKRRDKEFSVEFGRGSLVIECYQGGKMIDRKEIDELDFQKFTQHLVTFTLKGTQPVKLTFRQGDREPFDVPVSLQGADEE